MNMSFEYNLSKRERNLVDEFQKHTHYVFYNTLRENFHVRADEIYSELIAKLQSFDYKLASEIKAGIEDKIISYFHKNFSPIIEFDKLMNKVNPETYSLIELIEKEYFENQNKAISNLEHFKDVNELLDSFINMTLLEITTFDLSSKEITFDEVNHMYSKYNFLKKLVKSSHKEIILEPEFDVLLNVSFSLSNKDFLKYVSEFYDPYENIYAFLANERSFTNLKDAIDVYQEMKKDTTSFLDTLAKKNIFLTEPVFNMRYELIVPNLRININDGYENKYLVALNVSYYSRPYREYLLEKVFKIKSFNSEILPYDHYSLRLTHICEEVVSDPLKKDAVFLGSIKNLIYDCQVNEANYSNIFLNKLKDRYLKIAYYCLLIESLDLLQDYFNYSDKLEKYKNFLKYMDDKCYLK